ncbi:TRAP transporter large permease [Neptunomonas phycophila]|uniref:TRAP transporter large permease protein n=1 Tax=Neptunomonas phycophila TaxID=1572645 RepID=A0ABT9EV46_9GAMM|nr:MULTISPECIES: TRAP transporter large permease [Neptunomonas]MDN2658930.1 TRAP transporter large permease [Neptunomonas sp. CHC150]MDO6468876.1 TRAP transporter large permease [Neptunomonas phycophila]MDP2522805.1 TRAP transporter large permease [Neptunomonas phycophila]
MLTAMLIVFVVNVLLGLPLFISLLITSVTGFLFIDPSMMFRMLPQQFFGGINSFSLMAIPLFILSGNLMNAAGLTPKLIDFAKSLVGHLRGGLGYVNVVSSVFFAGVNGSAVADTSALGSLLVPAMKRDGYSASYAAGLTAGSSLIGPIIPPSIFMILYSSITNTSVGDLFLAGVIPGLLLGVAFLIINYCYARKANIAVSAEKPTIKSVFKAMVVAIPALLAPIIIVASIVFGFVTPTESGVLIVIYSLFVGLLSGNLSLKGAYKAVKETAVLTCAIFVIIGASSVVSWQLAYAQVPNEFASMLDPFIDNSVAILLFISLITFITGMLMEEVSALMLLTPVFAPVALHAGVDPVHLGIIITMNITIALITPPMGACVYVAAAVSKIELSEMFKSIWPFVGLALSVLVILIFFPSFTLFLPNLFK